MAQLKDLLVNGASRFIGNILGTDATLSGDVMPENDNTQSLGDGTHRWKLYGTIDKTFKIQLNNTQYTYDGSANVDLSTIYAPTASGTSGQVLQSNGSSAPSWITATNDNTASTIVKRDASGNFNAGTITASLTGTATNATNDGSGNNIINTYLTKAAGVTGVTWDDTNKKLTKTINGTTSDVVAITVNNPTLDWNTESTIAKIGTVAIKVKLPGNPNTNTLMRTYAHSTNKEFPILAGSTMTTSNPLTHTSNYASTYGAITTTAANRPTINMSTGAVTFPVRLNANGKVVLKKTVSYDTSLPLSSVVTGELFFTPVTTSGTSGSSSSFTATSDKFYVIGIKSASDSVLWYSTDVYVENNVLQGAAWNDYAEYRESFELEPGRVIIEVGNGRLTRSTERLQPGAEIISDTYGMIIGKGNPRCATPVAVSGRVLAYPDANRLTFAAGDAVCSGPNGTVSKMTREEIKEYPERIIGTVSEVPEYETWGEKNIKVDGRIWIRLR